MLTQWAKTAFLSGLGGVTGGALTVECGDRTHRFGNPGELNATVAVHDERFFQRVFGLEFVVVAGRADLGFAAVGGNGDDQGERQACEK